MGILSSRQPPDEIERVAEGRALRVSGRLILFLQFSGLSASASASLSATYW
jgi:hypothetical protein